MRGSRRSDADGRDIEMQSNVSAAVDRDGDQHAGPLRPQAAQADDDGDGEQRQRDGRRLDGAGRLAPMAASLGSSAAGSCAMSRPEQILHLAGEDDDRDAGGEADGDREGDVLDVGAEPQEADAIIMSAGHHRRQHQAVVAVPLDDARDRTMKAPAGPPIWNRLPPRAEIRKPPTMAVYRPWSGDRPEPMAMAIDSGSATMATVRPAMASARNGPAVAFAQDGDELRREQFGEARGRGLRPSGRGRIHNVCFLQERRRDRQTKAAP